MEIVFATGNSHKLREAQEILGEGFVLKSAAEVGITEDIPETGSTLEENSLQKARYIYDRLGCNCFADDTGLEVEALGGAPGVYSARYAGPSHDFNGNMDKLLRELQKAGAMTPEQRRARFRTVVTLILDGQIHTFEGEMRGHIALEKSGCAGFGYDPVFIPDEYPGQTVAELGEDVKNAISHRGRSLRVMAAWFDKK